MPITRRSFLELCGASSLTGFLPAVAQPTPVAGIVSVTGFGADPAGIKDSMAAVRQAILHLPKDGGVLDFPAGTYRFVPDGKTAMTFRGLTRFQLRGNGSHFLFDGDTPPIAVDQCSNVSLSDFTTDWATLPFSQGVVVDTRADSFVLELDPGFPTRDKMPIRAFGAYDRATRWPALNGIDAYNAVRDTAVLDPRTVRVNLTRPLTVERGATLVVRHNVYGIDGIRLDRSQHIVLTNISLYAQPGMGLLAGRCTGIKLDRFRTILKPGTNRLMSLSADSVHLSNCDGAIEIVNCSFQGMGDDAINICAQSFLLSARLDARSVGIQNGKKTALSPGTVPQASESVQICDRKTQEVLCEAKVVSVAPVTGDASTVRLVLDRDLSPRVDAGVLLCSAQEATHISIRNSSFLGNRARGVLLHKNAEIVGNTFAGCSLAAILLAGDTGWLEGPTVANVTISHNTFTDCYYAHPNDRRGTITVDTAHDRSAPATPPIAVNRNVTIADNTFVRSPGAAIYCAGVAGLVLRGNDVG